MEEGGDLDIGEGGVHRLDLQVILVDLVHLNITLQTGYNNSKNKLLDAKASLCSTPVSQSVS